MYLCVCVCVLLDDILIFVSFRLEASVSHSPMVKGKNKRHTGLGARSRAHVHGARATLLAVERFKLSGPVLTLLLHRLDKKVKGTEVD